MSSHRFPRTARVRTRAQFDHIFKQGRRVALPTLSLHVEPGDSTLRNGGPRLGLAVSRKVDPHAVGRNRIKRALRETFRHHRAQLADGDYVVVARVGAARCSGNELRQAFLTLLQRAGGLSALPLSPAPGTMPAPASCADAIPDTGSA